MTKNLRLPLVLLAVAALVTSLGYLLRSVEPAHAQDVGPFVVGGEAPWVSVAGLTSTVDEVVYNVPADRIFVLTAMCIGNNYNSAPVYELASSSTTKIHGVRNGCTYFSVGSHNNFITNGNARIPFAPGSGVQLSLPAGVPYTIQGFLAQP
jgi:hypothetical protein